MFQKIKQSITTPPRGKSSSKPNEDESTSLLSSNSAPPSQPAAPSVTEEEQLLFQQQQQQLLSARHLTEQQQGGNGLMMSIEEMERGAKRLISDNIGDSDSVNNLLKDEDEDSMSSYSIHGGGGSGEGYSDDNDAAVTDDDLKYLTSSTSQQQQPEDDKTKKTVTIQERQSSGTTTSRLRRPSTRRMVDEIGNQLLEAQGNARLEHDILRKSLNLDAGNIAALMQMQQDDDDGNVEEEEDAGDRETERVLERIHESTRKLRAASFDGGVSDGKNQPPEIEKEELLDYEQHRKRMVRQVLTMVGVTAILILLVCVALALGTIAVGPPRQPVGAYKIIEAQVGQDFWQYYDFYAGKDSAGSNGYIMYVSEQKAREEGIVNVVTETVAVGDMIEIYEDGDPRKEEDWLAEDLAFLDELKRKKLEEEEEALEKEEAEEEEAAEKKKKHDKNKKTSTTDSSVTATATDKTDQAEDTVTEEKKATRSLEEVELQQEQQQAQQQLVSGSSVTSPEISDETKPPKLEPFNPDQTSD
eukprot:scaffold16517_cov102-Skeletonema_dohrnii-CCMP3373.AAC.1